MLLASGIDIESWAVRLDARALFPKLIGKLVLATVSDVIEIDFPSEDGIQLRGWDGILHVSQGNAFVPEGVSRWELGVGEDPASKANKEYKKRSRNPLV